ncbi:transmembrane protein 150A isoform X2 [Gouania willdenowi]|uniref:transmembrane protein 150A isoform X2 n=1 Tax=Gouania willdenowi TaxID=441366 RepID=UPI001056118E|nr:transmembrane protein 150A-like isoform X2 [Gouania willdenowi]
MVWLSPTSMSANTSRCTMNRSTDCCFPPTISSSGIHPPENSLFTAAINAGAFLFLLFTIFHHAHIMEKHAHHSLISRTALVFGIVSSLGAFAAGNCNPGYLTLLHNLGAAISFICICFYSTLLTSLTGRYVLSGYEWILYPLRIVSTVLQVIMTISYTCLYVQDDYIYSHLAAVFEWMLSFNLELFEISFAVEFAFFSSYMVSNLLNTREEEKPLMLRLS